MRDRLKSRARRHGWRIPAVLAASVLSAELLLRLFVAPTWPVVETEFIPSDRNCVRPVPGSSRKYYPSGLFSNPAVHSVNALGFRGPVPGKTADGAVTVAVVGSGVVFGTGMPDNLTLPHQIETMLRDDGRGRAQVVNLGLPDFNIEELSFEYSHIAAGLKPDITIVVVDGGMLGPPACANAALPFRNWLQRISALSRQIEIGLRGTSMGLGTGFSLTPSENAVSVILNRFRKAAPDAKLVLVRLARIGLFRNSGDSEPVPVDFDAVAEAAGFSVIDLSQTPTNADGRPLKALFSEKDLSAETVAAAARRIATAIEPFIAVPDAS